jgi:hypothetical protein
MPYETRPVGDKVEVVSKDTGRVVATHLPPDAQDKADKQIHLLEAVEHDKNWKPTHGTE